MTTEVCLRLSPIRIALCHGRLCRVGSGQPNMHRVKHALSRPLE